MTEGGRKEDDIHILRELAAKGTLFPHLTVRNCCAQPRAVPGETETGATGWPV